MEPNHTTARMHGPSINHSLFSAASHIHFTFSVLYSRLILYQHVHCAVHMSAKNLHKIEENCTFFPRWLINNDDRSSFGDQESNADADRVFDVRDSLGVSQCRC